MSGSIAGPSKGTRSRLMQFLSRYQGASRAVSSPPGGRSARGAAIEPGKDTMEGVAVADPAVIPL